MGNKKQKGREGEREEEEEEEEMTTERRIHERRGFSFSMTDFGGWVTLCCPGLSCPL